MLVGTCLVVLAFVLFRIAYRNQWKKKNRYLKNAKTLIVIGSGGHTMEMMKLVRTLNPKLYAPRLYVMADGDTSSEHKIRQLEEEFVSLGSSQEYDVVKIPRSRAVNQSYSSSILTTLYSTVKSIPIIVRFKPDLILCNGPGTCVPYLPINSSDSIRREAVDMPLKGVKVVELGGLAPGPFCAAILADFGASVIRIDRVTSGSDGDCLTSGKKSLALDLKAKRGKEIFLKLSAKSDVILEPFRRGVMEKLGLGPEVLTKMHPHLIYARLTGFGQNGAYSNMAGHDINFLSMSGLLSFLGRRNEKPTAPLNLAGDFGGGSLTCAFGIVLALLERGKSGKGQVIDCSMVEGAAYLSSWVFRSQNLPIWGRKRGENILDTGAHFYDTYETKDGKFVAVGALESQFYQILVDKLQSSELDAQWTDFDKKKDIMEQIFKSKTRDEWCQIFDGTDACVTPVLDVTDVAEHPHNKERRSFTKSTEGLLVPQAAPILSRTPGISKGTLPHVENGAHTEEILLMLGYSREEVSDLHATGIVKVVNHSKL